MLLNVALDKHFSSNLRRCQHVNLLPMWKVQCQNLYFPLRFLEFPFCTIILLTIKNKLRSISEFDLGILTNQSGLPTSSSNPNEEKIVTLAYIRIYCEILLPQTDKKIHEFVLKTY